MSDKAWEKIFNDFQMDNHDFSKTAFEHLYVLKKIQEIVKAYPLTN
jgi:hypothetical protein